MKSLRVDLAVLRLELFRVDLILMAIPTRSLRISCSRLARSQTSGKALLQGQELAVSKTGKVLKKGVEENDRKHIYRWCLGRVAEWQTLRT
jgi:hypothetical protein